MSGVDWLSISIIMWSSLIALVVFGITYCNHKYKSIKAQFNLKGPRPLPVFGNLIQYFTHPRPKLFLSWAKKYGKLSIHFVGLHPRVVIADREILRQACTKDFDYMSDHYFPEQLIDKTMSQALFFQKGSDWKMTRSLLSPTFTSSRMKRMFKLLDICADDLVECINEQIDANYERSKSYDNFIMKSKVTYSLYTLDGIASCCFALKIVREKGDFSLDSSATRNELANDLKKIFSRDLVRTICIFLLPSSLQKYVWESSSSEGIRKLANKMRKIAESRSSNKDKSKKYDDYLQILLDSNLNDNMVLSSHDESENHHVNHSSKTMIEEHEKMKKEVEKSFSKIEISQEQLISNSLAFLVVGLETTSSLLTLITYCLAHHQQVQQKLYEILSTIATKSPISDEATATDSTHRYEFDYNKLLTCDYLDAVISETLRLLTPVPIMERIVNYDYRIDKYNTTLPKGTIVTLDFHSIHRDPDNWVRPDEFDPERFMPNNRHTILPGSYTPFSQGPRHCIGMRFSLVETKLGLAKVLMKYKFTKIEGSPFPPEEIAAVGVHGYKVIDVLINRRSQID